jgi:hypothetical protein
MLEAAGVRVYVGKVLPRGLTAIHLPDGDIGHVARVVTQWPSVSAMGTIPRSHSSTEQNLRGERG